MIAQAIRFISGSAALVVFSTSLAQGTKQASAWQDDFGIASCTMQTKGRNPYIVLEPGFQLVLEGGGVKLQITVLDQTRTIDGVDTRVVEEKEWKAGKVHEVTMSYLAMCEQTKDVLYFGEDVDNYRDGKVVDHEGAWRAGTRGSKVGLFVPGSPKLQRKYYREIVPGLSMEQAEIVSLDETCKTPAGTFSRCMKVKGTSAIDRNKTEYRYYAPDIGLVREENLRLTKYGFIKAK
jgi:hypothetical protein